MQGLKLLFGCCLLILLHSCKKEELEVIPGNQAPADNTITDSRYRQYINRCYILIHGGEPDSTAMNSALNILKNGNFAEASRRQFLDILFNSTDYKWQVFNTSRLDYLNNTDTTDIRQQYQLFTLLSTDSAYISVWPILQYELDRMQLLLDAGSSYASGSISIRELHKRFINNWFYDQINMGSANFVTFSFQQFFNRNPQAQELASGVSMVEGNFSTLFLQSGSSKEDYLAIFFNSNDYNEGAVVRFYQRFLQRMPDSQEMNEASQKFVTTGDYEQIQKDILAGNEFAGI